MENFFTALVEPLKTFEERLNKDVQALEKSLQTFENNEINKDEETIHIHKRIKKLETISKGIKI